VTKSFLRFEGEDVNVLGQPERIRLKLLEQSILESSHFYCVNRSILHVLISN
jgi:hypothetical protein